MHQAANIERLAQSIASRVVALQKRASEIEARISHLEDLPGRIKLYKLLVRQCEEMGLDVESEPGRRAG